MEERGVEEEKGQAIVDEVARQETEEVVSGVEVEQDEEDEE